MKLHYFHGRGRAQQSRWALAAAAMPFVNVCLSTAADFDELCGTGKLAYRQVPMLEEEGGRCISQSMAIVRHAARQGNLYGTTADEAARIDEVLDGISDARGAIVSYPFMQDPGEATARLQQSAARFFPCFEAIIERNAQPPFAVGANLTIADVLLAELVESCCEAMGGDELVAPFPRLKAVHAHVLGLPQIRAFMGGENWFAFPKGDVGATYVRNVRTVLA